MALKATLKDSNGQTIGWVCGPGSKDIRKVSKRGVKKWCFGCRKRMLHDYYVIFQEWYDPHGYYECRNKTPWCSTRFPGF